MPKKKMSGVDCLIQVLDALTDCECGNVVEGSITLNQGHHEVTVDTEVAPVEVYLSIDSGNSAVCNGDVDVAGYRLLPNGFVLYADIKSNSAVVNYIVEHK